jgi:FKBP-type peptidyl-prolyl cis-trans isomerase
MIAPRRLLPLPLLLIALAGAGCGDEKTEKDVAGSATEQTTAESATTAAEGATTTDGATATEDTTSTAATTTSAGGGDSDAAVKKLVAGVGSNLKTAPKITSPSATPPSELVKKDVVVGKGTAAKIGDKVTVRYTLVNWGGDDSPVDSSWARTPNSTEFPLEQGGLIEGWIKGVPGMKPGGRRVLVVPAAQGYGDQGTPDGSVPPGGTLIFVIDLVKTR